jgi:excisionase family DNA binding protein
MRETLGLVSPRVPEPTEGDLLTVAEVAKFMSVSVSTIRKWCAEGQIPHGRLAGTIRFEREQLQEWVDAGWRSTPNAPDASAPAE